MKKVLLPVFLFPEVGCWSRQSAAQVQAPAATDLEHISTLFTITSIQLSLCSINFKSHDRVWITILNSCFFLLLACFPHLDYSLLQGFCLSWAEFSSSIFLFCVMLMLLSLMPVLVCTVTGLLLFILQSFHACMWKGREVQEVKIKNIYRKWKVLSFFLFFFFFFNRSGPELYYFGRIRHIKLSPMFPPGTSPLCCRTEADFSVTELMCFSLALFTFRRVKDPNHYK